jgi:hypothetical protein
MAEGEKGIVSGAACPITVIAVWIGVEIVQIGSAVVDGKISGLGAYETMRTRRRKVKKIHHAVTRRAADPSASQQLAAHHLGYLMRDDGKKIILTRGNAVGVVEIEDRAAGEPDITVEIAARTLQAHGLRLRGGHPIVAAIGIVQRQRADRRYVAG